VPTIRYVDLGAPELLIILVVLLLLFGGAKLPQLARSLGQAKSEFEKSVKGDPDPPAKAAAEARVAESMPVVVTPVVVTPVVAPADGPTDTVTLSHDELERVIEARIQAAKAKETGDELS
jgi:sec-independent protein translocase protein TatA